MKAGFPGVGRNRFRRRLVGYYSALRHVWYVYRSEFQGREDRP